MGAITGPGDDTDLRMAINLSIDKGSTMQIETGEAQPALILQVTGRTLADVSETERRDYVISVEQAIWLAGHLARLAMEISG